MSAQNPKKIDPYPFVHKKSTLPQPPFHLIRVDKQFSKNFEYFTKSSD